MAKWTEAQRLEHKIRQRFHEACKEYALLEDGDKVLVALSGGKDSLELVRLLAAQAKIHKPAIQVEVAHVVMTNIPYETDRTYIQQFCEEQGLTLHILRTSFDDSESTLAGLARKRRTKCFLCSWNRRKALFEFAVQNGFNKLCLGHHQDDFIVTYLMNQMLEGRIETMKPAMSMEHYPLTIIRPLCMVEESDIAALADLLNFARQKTICPYDTATMRATATDLFRQMEEMAPIARHNLWACCKKTWEG